jgi:hypothetical protein
MRIHTGTFGLWIVAASLFTLNACHKPAESSPPEAPAAETAPPPEAPKIIAPAATPAPDPLAPEGTYFLLTKISAETSDGIVGYPAGTQVQKTADGRYQAPDGQFLTLAPNQFTNNLRVAGQAAGADAAARAALIEATRRREVEAARSVPQSAATAAAATPEPRRAAPPPPRPATSALDAGAHDYTKRYR